MKRVYEEPEITIETFAIEDVITTSGTRDPDELPLEPENNN